MSEKPTLETLGQASAEFQAKLAKVLHFNPVTDGPNISEYLNRVLEGLLELNQEVVSRFLQRSMPDTQPSQVRMKKKGEDAAYRAFGLPSIDEIVERANEKLSLYHEARDAMDKSEVTLEFPSIPPDEIETPPRPKAPHGPSGYPSPQVNPRIYALAFQLLNAGIELDEHLNILYSGKLEGSGRRLTPYKALLIPQLNRIVLECDTAGNKAYVFDLNLVASFFGHEGNTDLTALEREEIARTLLARKKSELIDIISDHEGIGATIDHHGSDWLSAMTAAMLQDFAGQAPMPEEIEGFKNRPLERNPLSNSYGLYKTRIGEHFGPIIWILKYFKEEMGFLVGRSTVADVVAQHKPPSSYFLGLNDVATKGWSCEAIYSLLTKNRQVLHVDHHSSDDEGKWRGFALLDQKHYGPVETIVNRLAEYFGEQVGYKMIHSVIEILSLSARQIRALNKGEVPGYPYEDIAEYLEEIYTAPLPLSSGQYAGFVQIGIRNQRKHYASAERIRRYLGAGFNSVLAAIETENLPFKRLRVRAQGSLVKMYCLEDVQAALEKRL